MLGLDSSAPTPEKLPVLYLDWDGVINFMGSRSQHRKRSGLGYMRRGSASPLPETLNSNGYDSPFRSGPFPLNWSAELLRKLSALPVEIVVLSTWRHSFSELLKATQWDLEHYRVLDWADGPRGSEHSGKVLALLMDQLMEPRPFIWADDEAHDFYTDELRAKLSHVPQLLIAPDENLGITLEDYRSMVSFLDGLNEPADSAN